jgi:hypothetical protein
LRLVRAQIIGAARSKRSATPYDSCRRTKRSDPDDDIVERSDRYYVYLKPHGADDDAPRTRMKLKGDPPV